MKKRLPACLLAAAMLISLFPLPALAAEPYGGGLCRHHVEHSVEVCGCTEAAEDRPCGYVCPVCPVQDMIDALPTAGELSGMSGDGQNEVYIALQAAYDAYGALTGKQKEEISGAEIFDSLFAFFNGMVNLLDTREVSITSGSVTITDACGSSCPGHTITGTSSANTIAVESGTHDIILQGVKIDVSNRSATAAFSIADSAVVNLTLKGENALTSGDGYAGLQVPDDAMLVITKESTGILTATGGGSGAGIGGGSTGNDGGTITINGGTVNATGGGVGAGIGSSSGSNIGSIITINGGIVNAFGGLHGAGIGGGGYYAVGGAITITGGTVNAQGGLNSAGIGGGDGGDGGTIAISGGTVNAIGSKLGAGSGAGIGGGGGGDGDIITISGGIVTAKGTNSGAGIGGGSGGDGGIITISGGTVEASSGVSGAGIGGGSSGAGVEITITGGIVTASSRANGAGIGGGSDGTDGTFAANGNAFIVTNSISDQSGDSSGSWKGVIFEQYEGWVYGSDPITLTTDAEVPSLDKLLIQSSQTLIIPDGVTLTNSGAISGDGMIVVEAGGQLVRNPVECKVLWLSEETGVTAVSVNGTNGTVDGANDAIFNVILPWGTTSLPTDSSTINIIPKTPGAPISDPVTANNGATWTFTVTAKEWPAAIKKYTIKVSIAPDPAKENKAAIAAAKSTIEARDWTVEQSTANTEAEVKTWIENQLAAMSLNGAAYTVSMTGFTAAAAGSSADIDGTNGSFTFRVSLSKGAGASFAEGTTAGINGTITATPYAEYTVTFDAQGGSVIPATMETTGGKLQSLPVPSRSNHTFEGWFTQAGGGEKVTTDTIFAADITIYAHWKYTGGSSNGGGGWNDTSATYTITALNTAHGKVTVSPTRAARGAVVTVTTVPDEGYRLDALNAASGGKAVPLTDKGNGEYTFTMPAGAVWVEAAFVLAETPWVNPFADVSEGDWYYEAVRFVQENDLMNGYGGGNFAPNAQLSRAQLAQILFNKEGRPGVDYLLDFSDVAGEAWYTEAIRWTASQGIVGGYGNGTFGPDDPITREQLAVMLWRYSGSPAAASRELYFNDTDEISGFALEALRWAVENGILNGYGDGRLGPQGQATRAQVAQMLKNFIGNRDDNI